MSELLRERLDDEEVVFDTRIGTVYRVAPKRVRAFRRLRSDVTRRAFLVAGGAGITAMVVPPASAIVSGVLPCTGGDLTGCKCVGDHGRDVSDCLQGVGVLCVHMNDIGNPDPVACHHYSSGGCPSSFVAVCECPGDPPPADPCGP